MQTVRINLALKNNAIRGNNQECIIFVKFQYPEVFNSFKDLEGNFLFNVHENNQFTWKVALKVFNLEFKSLGQILKCKMTGL